MPTIASPRPSFALSSRRGSDSTDATARSASTSLPTASNAGGSIRRNRTALRDYYNLQATAPADARNTSRLPPPPPALDAEQESELDRADFNPEAYVQTLLAREGLEGVLRVEAGLVSEIRSLDGEKKALVYDNYSKLIAATDTIRSMREKMDPLTPGTSELTGQIGYISATAESLAKEIRKHHGVGAGESEEVRRKRIQRETVRWVLGAPERLGHLLGEGKKQDAEADWREVCAMLAKWEGVKGVEDVQKHCLEVLESHNRD